MSGQQFPAASRARPRAASAARVASLAATSLFSSAEPPRGSGTRSFQCFGLLFLTVTSPPRYQHEVHPLGRHPLRMLAARRSPAEARGGAHLDAEEARHQAEGHHR